MRRRPARRSAAPDRAPSRTHRARDATLCTSSRDERIDRRSRAPARKTAPAHATDANGRSSTSCRFSPTARVVVPRARRNDPRAVAVDAPLRDAVDRHVHRAVEAEHDLMKVVHVRRLHRARSGAARRDGAMKRRASSTCYQHDAQTSSNSTSNTSVAFGGITPPAPRAP